MHGVLKQEHDTIHTWLKEDRNFLYTTSDKPGEGIEAITHYKVLNRGRINKYSLLQLELETGRKNQIRVHMQSIGHPVVGDYKYGIKDDDPLKRLALHAFSLSFHHPVSGKPMSFELPYPKSFLSLIR